MECPKSKTLGDYLDEMASKFSDREAIIFKDQRYTYKNFRDEANQIAKALFKLGLKRGEKVATLINNRSEWLTLAFGVAKAGGVLVPLSTFYRSREVEYALRHCGVKILFTVGKFLGFDYIKMVREILPTLETSEPGKGEFEGFPDLKYVVSLGEQTKGTYTWGDFFYFGENVSDEVLMKVQASVQPKELAFIMLTSGTTAHPKAVQLVHNAVIENSFNIGERQHLTPKDRLWVGIPVFYAMFNSNAMGAIMSHGGTMVIQESFDAGESLRLIEKEKCTVIYGFYNMIAAILNHPDRSKRDLRSLRTGETIGTPEQIRLMAELAPNICNVYGLTEVHGNSHLTDSDDPLDLRCKTSGKLLPGFEMKVADDAGHPVPPGEVGEACFRGPYVTPGYYKDPENNALAFDKEGWFHTGDLVIEDKDGYFYFVTRKKDMIKTGGINVSPATVEDFLMSHPKVKEVHVIGFPDKKKDQVVMAVVELKAGEEATQEEFIQYCKGKIAGYSIPAYVCFVRGEEWPRTVTGKVPGSKVKELMLQKFKPEK